MRKFLVLLVAIAACGGGSDGTNDLGDIPPLAIVANSDLAVGPQRVLVGLRDLATGDPLESPDRQVRVEIFRPTDLESPVFTADAKFLWLVPEFNGVYATSYQFDQPGQWAIRLTPSDLPASDVTPFVVLAEALTPDVGDPAPASESLTLADAELAVLTTDPQPDSRFYEKTIAAVVTSGSPAVIVFATPAFCTSRTCGPTLDSAKDIRDEYPGTAFVHVEVFDLTQAPAEMVPVPAVLEWSLPSEPWVFVTDSNGVIAYRFEGIVSPDELRAALATVG